MKVGLVITTFNRPNEFAKCIESLKESTLPDEVLIVDDGSSDPETIDLINTCGFDAYQHPFNYGVHASLIYGFLKLFKTCDVVMNLDADAIVAPNYLEVLMNLHYMFPNYIVSGFNTITANRHHIISQHKGYCLKKSIGGINMLMTKDTYLKYLHVNLKNGYGWDWGVCGLVAQRKIPFVVSTPSVIDHIGFESTLGHNTNIDKAVDFKLNKIHG
jgi:glycosyltransferase involved in cell wall biosynthesis